MFVIRFLVAMSSPREIFASLATKFKFDEKIVQNFLIWVLSSFYQTSGSLPKTKPKWRKPSLMEWKGCQPLACSGQGPSAGPGWPLVLQKKRWGKFERPRRMRTKMPSCHQTSWME